jgi:polar amino acid transport system substrate-binding protein
MGWCPGICLRERFREGRDGVALQSCVRLAMTISHRVEGSGQAARATFPACVHVAALFVLAVVLVTLTTWPGEGCAMSDRAPADATSALAPRGSLRAAINLGNPVLARKDRATGAPRGVSVDLAHELGRRLGVPVELVTFDAAGKVFDGLASGAWDVAFLAIEPARSAAIDFTPPYVLIEGTYLVPSGSPLHAIEDVDRDGVRVAVGRGSAYDLYLTRTLKHATIVRAETSPAAIELFLADGLDAAAGVRQPLAAFAKTHPNLRVMEARFMSIEQAMGTPRGREAGARFLRAFIAEMISTGVVARALAASGQSDVTVAPARP